MEFFHKTPNIQFLAVRKPALVMSLVVLVVCVASLAIRGLNLGVEFTGGVTVQVLYPKPADLHTVRGELASAGYPNAIAQNYGNPQEVLIRLQPKKGVSGTDTGNDVVKILQKADPQVKLGHTYYVGPQVGKDLATKGTLAFILTLGGILIYIMFRFEWRLALG